MSANADLRELVTAHPALSHPFLRRFAQGGLSREQMLAFGLQHYQLVRIFTTYMTNLVARRPDWAAALRPVLDDEFGQYTIFRSHVQLYRTFLKSLGASDQDWGRVGLRPETKAFIDGHLELTRSGDPLAALGALGPGHELSIPPMFASLVSGLRAAGIDDRGLEYFLVHIEEDQHHAAAFGGLIERHAPEAGALDRLREGTLFSLDLRSRFWDGCAAAVYGLEEALR